MAVNAELEARLAATTEELDAARKELEGFSYSVAHDLKAPLRIIDGFSGILLEDPEKGDLPPTSRHQLELIHNSARQMLAQINDLIEFSRLSRTELRTRDVKLAPIVDRLVDHMKAAEPGRDINVVVGRLPDCRGDEDLLGKVFANLLSNALKFSGGRDRTKITVGSRADAVTGPHYFVRDNGVGFDSRYANKLFGVFQRLHRAEDYPGTGMGLATVQRIVHRHGGRVWAEAAPDRGATFFFTLGPRP